jgi:hypothetical protein
MMSGSLVFLRVIACSITDRFDRARFAAACTTNADRLGRAYPRSEKLIVLGEGRTPIRRA